LVNAIINYKPGEKERKGYGLLYRKNSETALEFTVGKHKKHEER
jgi:hypothetical protein